MELISLRHDVGLRRGMDPGRCINNRRLGRLAFRPGLQAPRSAPCPATEDNHACFLSESHPPIMYIVQNVQH